VKEHIVKLAVSIKHLKGPKIARKKEPKTFKVKLNKSQLRLEGKRYHEIDVRYQVVVSIFKKFQ